MAEEREVSHVKVRIPPFWAQDPDIWFTQLECQFELSKITRDETKFNYVVSQLDTKYVMEVKDVIRNPPEKDKYIKLKTELIKRLSASQEKRLKQLLEREELGDRKPSQFYRHLQDLAGIDVPNKLIQTIWTSRLPQGIQTVLASRKDEPLEYLADLADSVFDIATPSWQVTGTSSASTSSGLNSFEEMTKQISALTQQVASLSKQVRPKGRSYSRSRQHNRSRSRSRPRQPPPDHPHCFYHFTYKDKAIKCKQPCTFKKSENAQGSRK